MKNLYIEQNGHVIELSQVRTDYIYRDKYASLGKAVLERMPLAFLSDTDPQRTQFESAKMLPLPLSLADMGRVLTFLEGR